MSQGATLAARKALEQSNVRPQDMEVLIYAAVCREQFEPATACRVAAALGIEPDAVFDLSNACLGVLNGIVEIANRIELGQVRAGLVVSCETAREINDAMIETMLQTRNMETFKTSLATLTGGSGAVAVLVTDGSFARNAAAAAAGRHDAGGAAASRPVPLGHRRPCSNAARQFMSTDSVAVLKYGVELGLRTWKAFLDTARLGHRHGGQGHLPPGRRRPPRPDPQDAGHLAGQGIFDLRVPRQHGHGVAAADGGAGGGARVPAARATASASSASAAA